MIRRNEMLSLIVPCYNEQEALPVFYEEVTKVASKLSQDYEIIFIDDGSKAVSYTHLRAHET